MSDDKDYYVKRAFHWEGIGDQHFTAMEYKKALKMFKDSFGNFKKAGEKDNALRIKDKYDKTLAKIKENQ
ncbi:MAG: hypothetical protein GY870_09410 [archaeon]|nr:hypothetical protein [archaeon]